MIPIESFLDISPLNWKALLTSLLCGTLLGAERQFRGKPVGIRTASLITLGTSLVIILSKSVVAEATDPSRIIGQMITGIGFIGAGVMFSRDGLVQGVTSAATIWILAAIGIAIGLGYYEAAVKVSLYALLILTSVNVLERLFKSLNRGVHVKNAKAGNQSISDQ
ncbi:MgtC/SapB family protein [Endozoicomonas elysicola]|uniref:Protein MgtC n=1 Tax=Endozoicomonas elysicola TaxID=305900 RepID=A0A081KDQ2_9GAMM|nr:MgtC/SapB family protein [Endozoicomonas elysicola]KEI72278.1 membrane protein [Endozoicomonas elysicola]